MSTVAKVHFTDYASSIREALDLIGAAEQLPTDIPIILKPNLTNSSKPPVTTDVAAVDAVFQYCREHTDAPIAVGEGCGSGRTPDVYRALGYTGWAKEHDVELIDFNEAETVLVHNERAMQLREFHMPKVLLNAFVISIPVLKDHSFTETTIAMKNMFGMAPATFYRGAWNKSKLHSPSTDHSVFDLCLYKRPDLSVVDASTALTGMHLAGTPVTMNLILASFDCLAVDAVGSQLLGHDPEALEYLRISEGVHGSMRDIKNLCISFQHGV